MTYHTTEELIDGRSEWAVETDNFNGLIDSHILANQRIAELEAQLSSENLELSAASREFWNSVSNLAKTRISELESERATAERRGAVKELRRLAGFYRVSIVPGAVALAMRLEDHAAELEGKCTTNS